MIEVTHLEKIFNASPLPSLLLLPNFPNFTIARANAAYLNCTEKSATDLVGNSIFSAFKNHSTNNAISGMDVLLRSFQTVADTGISDKIYTHCYFLSGNQTDAFDKKFLNVENVAILNDENKVAFILHTATPVIESWYNQELERLERDILERSAKKELPTREILCAFMLGIEKMHPGMRCSMQEKKGNQLFNLASPGLPNELLEAMNGIEIESNVVTCGAAAFLKKPIATRDIENDIRWENYREIANRHQLKACFSNPVVDSKGNVIATFSTYFCEKKVPATHEQNTIQRAGHILQIIFERSIKEDAVEASEEKLRNLVWDMQVGVILQGPKAEMIFCNPKALEFLGLDEDQLLNKTSFDPDWNVIHEDGSVFAGPDHPVPQAIANRRPVREVVMGVYRPRIGDRVWLLVDAEPQLNSDGTVRQVVCTFINITKRKIAEATLVEQDVKLNAILDSTSSPVFSIDCDFRYTSFNKAHLANMKSIYGVDIEIGTNALDYQNLIDDRESTRIHLDRALAGEQFVASGYSGEGGLLRRYFEINHNPIYTASGEIIGVSVFANDLTNRKLAEDALKASEERYRSILIASPDQIAITDLQGRILMVSPSAVQKLAVEKEEDLVGRLITDFIIPEDRPKAESKIAQMFEGILSGAGDYRGLRSDGITFNIEANAEFIRDVAGLPKQIVFIIRDTTERKLAQQALQDSELRYRALVESSPDAIGVYRNGRVIYTNSAGIKMFGAKSPDEIIGISILDLVHPAFRQITLDRIRIITETNETLPMAEMKFLKLGGNSIDVEVQSSLIDYDGEPAIQVTVRDISKRKQEEQHLRLLESVITHANDGVLIAEVNPTELAELRIIYVNDSFTKMTGYSCEEVIGKTSAILQGPKTDVHESQRLADSIKNCEPCEITQINYKKSGEIFWVHLSISPVADEKGIYTHWISIQKDITEIKNEELKKTLFAEISALFSSQTTLDITLEMVMNRIKLFGDFVLAESWLVGSNKKAIKLVATSPLSAISRSFYEESAHINSLEKGEGLPGITWQTGCPQFWEDIQIEKNFIRKEAAKKVGIQSFYSLPIISNKEIIGVLILGSLNNETSLENISTNFKNLGIHIGDEIRRKQLEHELFQIFNFAPDIICISDFEGYFKKVNPAACKLLEYSEEELKAVPSNDFVHPEDRDKTGREITTLSNGISNYYFENRFITKSGKIKWLAWTASPSPADGIILGVAKDITERKTLEDLLAKVNKLARIGGWELDLVKNSLYWSDMTKEIHEVDVDYLPKLETGINFYVEGEARALIARCVAEGISKGQEWDIEVQILTAKGNIRWVRSMGEAEFLNEKCIRIYGSFQDIDSRKKVELALQHNMKMLEDYQFALDQSAIISITDEKGIILSANDNFCKISKYQKEELEGNSHRLVNSDFHSKDFFHEFWQTIQSGEIWRGEIKNKTKYGEYYWVYATVIPFLDIDKKPFQYLAIRFDITEKKISEEAIHISNERYNLVAKATNDAIWDWNLETNQVVRAGEGLETLFGYAPADADKNDNFWNERTHPDDFERWQKKLKDTADEPLANYWEDEYRFRKANGIYAIVYEKGYIIRNPLGKAIRIIGATQDITKLKENEIHLNELNETLQQKAKELANSNAELEQFAYVASHDLQEPLRMVTGFLTQLERKYSASIDDTGKKYINFAVDGAKRMRQIILDLLEFSRLGRKEGCKENLDLNNLIAEIKILFQKHIDDKNAIITTDDLPAIDAYKTPIRQVFQNLIGNALKYSKSEMPVKIHISVTELADHWQFSVSDNGIGISEEYFEKIFIIFQRLHNKDEFSGTGIGLAVTKKVIENHGGKIWLTSDVGNGSTFYFTIKKEL